MLHCDDLLIRVDGTERSAVVVDYVGARHERQAVARVTQAQTVVVVIAQSRSESRVEQSHLGEDTLAKHGAEEGSIGTGTSSSPNVRARAWLASAGDAEASESGGRSCH